LDAEGYFALVRRTFQSIRIPARFTNPEKWLVVSPVEVKAEFIQANPGLREPMLSVQCGGNFLSEVRICLGKDLKPAPCSDRRECRAPQVRMPPVR
jgi:ribonuclease T2